MFSLKVFLFTIRNKYVVHQLVETLYIRQLTPDIENAINSDVDYEAL